MPPAVPCSETLTSLELKQLARRVAYHACRTSGLLALTRVRRIRSGEGWATGLVFHRLSRDIPEDGLTITPERFDGILRMLRRHYRVLSTAELATWLEEGRAFSGREVTITFDDGYLDNYELAAPLLEKHQLPACFFLTAGYVGTNREFPWDRERGVKSILMSWAQAREMAGMGFEIGCHTWSHPDLGTEPLTPASVQRELYDSRARIEDVTGTAIQHFAYPFGGRDNIRPEWIEAIRDAGYRTNSSADNGRITSRSDLHYIPRVGAAPQRSLTELRIDIDNPW